MAATTLNNSSCLLQPKSSSTARLNPSSLLKPRVSFSGKSRGHVVTKASIEMAHSNSTPAAVVNSSSKHKGPIIVIDNYDSFTYNLCQSLCFDMVIVSDVLSLLCVVSRCILLSKVYSTWISSCLTSSSSTHTRVKCIQFVLAVLIICFTYLFHTKYMGELGCHFEVYRNDELTVEELKSKNPRGVLISPGPGTPQDSGISLQTVLELGPRVPLFGVCMGLQCIGEAFGGKIVRSPYGVMHGKSSMVHYDEKGEEGLFSGLSNPFLVGRYHSLVIEKDTFPSDELEVTAWTEDGLVMAARHRKHKHIQGVQFHPESIITTEGKTIVRNFIKLVEKREAEKLT
ncbi:hypothetical protein HID58_055965 [Brassica napus]|uniref:anthranilate synthase n=1 Tax=Brassica napus TaxID=3708 RepID=A0ABQ8AM02_BRANA|nr:hypothetical protein HID58_055965 [Brassica napus]